MLKRFLKKIGGDPNKKEIESYEIIVGEINALEQQFENLNDDQLKQLTQQFKKRLAGEETLEDLLPEAFAVVREAAKRTIGLRHYDVQLIGGMILNDGKVAEMRTGEGKTLVATLPIYLNALTGKGVHLITVNDYLARRDARWMAPIFNILGLSVGVLQMGSRTEGGKFAFLVDLETSSSQEDQHQLKFVERQIAYQADVTYGTNSEFGFDYLRDNMKMSMANRAQRGHHYAIIDEVDNVLIDEARTPLIISGPSYDDAETYIEMAQVVKKLNPEDYEINEKDRNIALTELGETRIEQILGVALRDPDRPEDITPQQARLLGFLEQALRAQYLFKRNKDYLVQGGQVIIIDEFTGRLMPGRRWSDGLHQAVEAKEGVKVQSENITHATITIQNYFRMYEKLSGMTGTAMTEAEEFSKIYNLEVVALPSNVEFNASRPDTNLQEQTDRDEYDYEYTFYTHIDDPDRKPILWKRKDYPDVVYRTEEAKLRALVKEIVQYHCIGRPMLVGTTSVEKSEILSNRLKADQIQKMLQTFMLRRVWLDKHNRAEDGRTIMALSFLNEPLEKINASQLRQLARDLNIALNPGDSKNLPILLDILSLELDQQERLVNTIQKGISHNVLNARKHTEESQIIAQAGAFGAVTIATNMAGRGVDIKLGGEIAEEIIAIVNRLLKRSGIEEPYELPLEQQLEAIKKIPSEDYGIYTSEIGYFIQSMADMKMVKELGGLHVIGSERHEARRIDNQLRGRAARQGDPGSSRFYLSMEDELMRLFGGQQMESMMQRLGMDENIPLELNLVSRIIEGAQTRVEGANFDSRKHLLEYDDVLNSQRNTIYTQRDLIFQKEDLYEDVLDMLQTEIQSRVPRALMDSEGPWKLLSWLEQIQPPIIINREIFPSFSYKLLLDKLSNKSIKTVDQLIYEILNLVDYAIQAEADHILTGAQQSLTLIDQKLSEQLDDRFETVDTFIDALRYTDETDSRSGRELINEISGLVHVPLKLTNEEQNEFKLNPEEIKELLYSQIENTLTHQAIVKLIGAIERRFPEGLGLNPNQLVSEDWTTIQQEIINAINNTYQLRHDRLLGENNRENLSNYLRGILSDGQGKINGKQILPALLSITQEERTAFDKRTHKQIKVRQSRFSYLYYSSQLIANMPEQDLTLKVIDHLINAQQATNQLWGAAVWNQINSASIRSLPQNIQSRLMRVLGVEKFNSFLDHLVGDIPTPDRPAVAAELGRQELNEVYRTLILRVISELWVEYLTKMEALRISIGLEAYGQRDPLVMYKTKASAMFQELFEDMRMSVVTRMFAYRPTGLNTTDQIQHSSQPLPSENQPTIKPSTEKKELQTSDSANKKRRRRRK